MRLAPFVLIAWLCLPPAGATPPSFEALDAAAAQGEAALLARARAEPEWARLWLRSHLATGDPPVLRAVAAALRDDALVRVLDDPALAEHRARAASLGEAAIDWPLVVEDEAAAEIAFYSAIFHAARGDAGGLPLAQRLAEGRAVLVGALDWFGDLATWHGPLGVPAGADPTLTAALNAWQQGRPPLALLEQARDAAERSGDRWRALLIEHLAARLTPSGRTRAVQVLQAVRPLGRPAVTGAILAGLVHATDLTVGPGRRAPEADLPFLHELLDLGPAVYRQPWARAALRTADRQLTEAAARAPRAAATRLIDGQLRLATLLGDVEAQGLALTLAVRNRRQRGLDDEIPALVAAGEAISTLAATHRATLRTADLQARFALGAVVTDGDLPASMEENHWTFGHLRLAQGRLPAAFAHANAGLRRLRQSAHPDEAERRGLHDLAVAALREAGFEAEARARAAFGTLPPEGPGHQGCRLARTGRALEALAVLGGLGEEATEDAWVGRTCKAALELAAGRAEAATRSLNPLRTWANPDPLLHWRVLALAARLAHLRGRPVEAAHLAREAVQRWLALGAERPIAGGAALQSLALPESAAPLLAELPTWFAEAARAQPEAAAAHHRAAVDAVLLHHRVGAAPAILPGPPVAAEQVLRLTHVRLAELRGRAADPRLEAADRARLGTRIRRLVEASAQAHARLSLEHPERAGWLHPTAPEGLPDAVVLVYHFGPSKGHLWLVLPGQAPRPYALPDAAAVEGLLSLARAGMSAEKPLQIEYLQAPVPVIFPFLADPEVAAQVVDRPFVVVQDGPLEGFPLEALVLEPGAPPVFLGTRHRLHRRFGWGPGRTRPERPRGVGVVGSSILGRPAAPMATLADHLESHGALLVTEPGASAALGTGPVGAETVVWVERPAREVRAALHHRGVNSLIFLMNLPGDPFEEGGLLPDLVARLEAGEPGGAALRALQDAAMQADDPAVWHPARWARWVVDDALSAP